MCESTHQTRYLGHEIGINQYKRNKKTTKPILKKSKCQTIKSKKKISRKKYQLALNF
jgi:hypothetical protein